MNPRPYRVFDDKNRCVAMVKGPEQCAALISYGAGESVRYGLRTIYRFRNDEDAVQSRPEVEWSKRFVAFLKERVEAEISRLAAEARRKLKEAEEHRLNRGYIDSVTARMWTLSRAELEALRSVDKND